VTLDDDANLKIKKKNKNRKKPHKLIKKVYQTCYQPPIISLTKYLNNLLDKFFSDFIDVLRTFRECIRAPFVRVHSSKALFLPPKF